jgi:acyl carrier protein
MFSGFTVKTGAKKNDGVTDYYIRVPARYGDVSRMAATILKGNSENVVNSAPFIAAHVQSLQPDRQRLQEPFFNDAVSVNERAFDSTTNAYTSEPGNKYSVKRLMPVPYLLNMQVDVWTSNTDQKLQLLEQMLVLFNPALEIQHNDNPVDWTTITVVEMTDLQWTSRGIPAGVEDQIDIATMIFQIPIWINPPAQVTRQNVIRNVINNIYTYSDLDTIDYDPDAFEFFADLQAQSSVIVTPGNYALRVYENGSDVWCSPYANGNYNDNIPWSKVLKEYGTLDSGVSRLRLKYHGEVEDLNADVIGTLSTVVGVDNALKFTIDPATLPTNTVTSVDRIINASTAKPGFNGIPAVASGQRYLTLDSAKASSVWGIEIATGDILEYNGTAWVKSFDASANATREYVTNTFSSQQFKFEKGEWTDTYQGIYDGGYWRMELVVTP